MYSRYIKESGYFSFITGGIAASATTDAPLAFIIANVRHLVKGCCFFYPKDQRFDRIPRFMLS